MDRRSLLVCVALSSWSLPAMADDRLSYRGFTIDTSEVPSYNGYRVVESFKTQLDIIADSGIKPELLDFFHAQPIAVRRAVESGFRTGPKIGLELGIIELRRTDPLILRALLFRYANLAMADAAKSELTPFLAKAKTIAATKAAYLNPDVLRNIAFFFAQSASLYLFGMAESAPFDRKVLKQMQPDYCDWLANFFGVMK